MNAGSVRAKSNRFGMTIAVLCSLVVLVNCGVALAQTPDEACAADSLYLISPEEIDLRLETTGRTGLTISWPNLDANEATCFSLKDADNLGFDVVVTGGFNAQVDRVFQFSTTNTGQIGGTASENLTVNWQNVGQSIYGNYEGRINLSNNGGILRYANAGGWSQINGGLPMSWRQINTVGLATGTGGFMLAGFSRGVTAESDPVGLFTYDGNAWQQIATDLFDDSILITDIAVSPNSNDMFAVGTNRQGLFLTSDGGETFTQWTSNLEPDYQELPDNYRVNMVEWSGNRVFVFINNFGLFISENNGGSFSRSDFMVPSNLDDPPPRTMVLPIINALSFHPTDPNRVLAALDFHGVYESLDGGITWADRYGDLVVPDTDPDNAGAWVHSGLDAIYDEVSPQTIILGVKQNGLYRTTDGGSTWVNVGASVQPASIGSLLNLSIVRLTGSPGVIFILEDQHALLVSSDSGATWEEFYFQPLINRGYFLVEDAAGNGDLTMGSWGGGNFIAGSSIPLSATYTSGTAEDLRDEDLGLEITFSAGNITPADIFELVCQTFQGWAVWRGPASDPGSMTMLGLFDRVNPEACIVGYCGDVDIEIVPNCFATKRAACFDVSDPDTIRFFDEEIYNGFVYNYAVTSFDYGNTALTTPENNSNEMLFSPRFAGDEIDNGGISPFIGPGNLKSIQINEPVAIGEDGVEEIYVFPNPLREGAGFPRDEGGTVTFKNIPEGSQILVFTTSGDRVFDIGPEELRGGNMFWDTRNSSGESITSGVYLYKVEIPEKDPYWGRLVVIR